jgi:hypothetical protein
MKQCQYPVPSAAVEVLDAVVLSEAAVDADNDTSAMLMLLLIVSLLNQATLSSLLAVLYRHCASVSST